MFMLILRLIILFEVHVFAEGEICIICKCGFVNVPSVSLNHDESLEIKSFKFKADTVEPFNVNVTYGALQKYLYVDCSSENNVGQLTNLKWPELSILGIFANLWSSKRKKIASFPISVKNQMSILSLSNNLIHEIEEFELIDFSNLTMLNLSKNHVEVIKKGTFSKLNTLKILDLSSNIIKDIEGWSFFGTHLQYLNLSKNFIAYLTQDMFKGLNNLKVLDLSENKLEKLLDFGNVLPSLAMLSLRNNAIYKLRELPRDLKELDIGHNKLVELRLIHSSLEVLKIDFNEIRSLEEAKFPELKVLKISNNILTKLLGLKANRLRVLDISYNKFKEIPKVVSSDNLPFLEELYLDGNPISNITFPAQRIPFSHLRIISFTYLKSLKKISKNTFSGVFLNSSQNCANHSGIHLNFSCNSLKYVDKNVFTNIPLCVVDFSSNNLKTISENLLPWEKMSYVNLQDNPWQCDCNIQWMLDEFLVFMYKNRPDLLFNLRCSTPLRYNNKMFVFWYNNSENVFCNSGPSSFYLDLVGGKKIEIWTVSAIACVILGCFILIILVVILVLVCAKPVKPKKRPIKDIKKIKPPYYKLFKSSECNNI